MSTTHDGALLNLDNISFKGQEIAELMGLDELEDALNKIDHNREENTLDFSFNKESILPAPEFGGG